MQRDVKTGLIVGVVLVAIGVLFWSQSPESQRPAQFDEPDFIGGEALDPVAPTPMATLGDAFADIQTPTVFRLSEPSARPESEPSDAPRAERAPAPEPEPEPVAASRPEPGRRVHLVERGDSLWSLAAKYYGNGGKWKVIAEANRDALPNTDRLRPGMRLVIPPDPDREVAAAAPRLETQAEARPDTARPRTHLVVGGDNLVRLSERYYGTGRHWKQLFEANKDRLPSPHVLPVGVELVIPPPS